jgi:hypothetical protein
MKIALCLHGLFSSANDTTSNGFDGREHIQKNILDKGDVDVYVHSWETDKKDLIEAMYQPKKAIFESQIDFKETIIKRTILFTSKLRASENGLLNWKNCANSILNNINLLRDYDIKKK